MTGIKVTMKPTGLLAGQNCIYMSNLASNMLETFGRTVLQYCKVESVASCQIVKYGIENQWVLSILQCVIYSTIVYSFLYYIIELSYNTNNGSSNKQQPDWLIPHPEQYTTIAVRLPTDGADVRSIISRLDYINRSP